MAGFSRPPSRLGTPAILGRPGTPNRLQSQHHRPRSPFGGSSSSSPAAATAARSPSPSAASPDVDPATSASGLGAYMHTWVMARVMARVLMLQDAALFLFGSSDPSAWGVDEMDRHSCMHACVGMCMHGHVCMYVYAWGVDEMDRHSCMHGHAWACVCMGMCVCMCMHGHVYAWALVYGHAGCIGPHMHAHTCIGPYAHAHTCTCLYMHRPIHA